MRCPAAKTPAWPSITATLPPSRPVLQKPLGDAHAVVALDIADIVPDARDHRVIDVDDRNPLGLGDFQGRLEVGVGLGREQEGIEALRDEVLGDRELAELVALALRRLIDDLDPGLLGIGLVAFTEAAPVFVGQCLRDAADLACPSGAAGTSPNFA